MRLILLILFLISSLSGNGQVIKASVNYIPFTVAGSPSCPFALSFTSVVNLTESPSGTWWETSAFADGNAKGTTTITVTDSARFQCEYQSSQNTDHFAICWDANGSLSPSYYATSKFVVFVFAGEYWYNYNQTGAVNSTISAVDGDLFCLFRDVSGNIYAQYKSGAYWTNLSLMEEANTSVLTQYISSANEGDVNFTMLNPKYCIY